MDTSYTDRHWQSADGLTLHFREYGAANERPPVICLHGLTRNARDFEDLAPPIASQGWRVLVLPGSAATGVNTRLMALPSRVMVASGNEQIGATDPLVIGAASERELLERYGSRQNVARWNGAWRRAFETAQRRLESAWPNREI